MDTNYMISFILIEPKVITEGNLLDARKIA